MMTYFKFKIALSLAHEGRPYALLFDDTPRARDWQNSQDQKSTAFLLLVKSAHTAIDAALTDEMQTVEELVNDSVEPRVRLSRIKEFINDKAMTTENEVKKEADPPAAPKQTRRPIETLVASKSVRVSSATSSAQRGTIVGFTPPTNRAGKAMSAEYGRMTPTPRSLSAGGLSSGRGLAMAAGGSEGVSRSTSVAGAASNVGPGQRVSGPVWGTVNIGGITEATEAGRKALAEARAILASVGSVTRGSGVGRSGSIRRVNGTGTGSAPPTKPPRVKAPPGRCYRCGSFGDHMTYACKAPTRVDGGPCILENKMFGENAHRNVGSKHPAIEGKRVCPVFLFQNNTCKETPCKFVHTCTICGSALHHPDLCASASWTDPAKLGKPTPD